MSNRLDSYRHLKDHFLTCRYTKHAWKWLGFFTGEARGEVISAFRCRDCGTTREDVVRKTTMAIERRKYEYPDDYQVKGGVNAVDVRAELMRRMPPKSRSLKS